MSRGTKYVIGGVGITLIALLLLPGWLVALIIVALVALPVAAYLLLDSSQRRRLWRANRKQIGR
jgi:hypothetical protein